MTVPLMVRLTCTISMGTNSYILLEMDGDKTTVH